MVQKVNLDALIRREDFEVKDDSVQFQAVQTIQIRDLEPDALFYQVLRKPDFQRETADWTPDKISEFVQSFLNGDLIPGIILWNSGSYIFVIDGGHRLSALIAWVQDDYGDGNVSRPFFGQSIPGEQASSADMTRRLVQQKTGDYKEHKSAIQHPESRSPELLERARRLASLAIQVQWVRGDTRKAEASFFKINQQAVAIDKTELRLIKGRKKPNSLAARAITRAGTGHKYWSDFDESKQQQIQTIAKEINTVLFTPPLRTPIKTLDLPIAGQGYSSQTLQLVLELVNLTNNDRLDDSHEDKDGNDTVQFLKNTQKLVNRISGLHPSSLGLHPAVYFYGANGRYQPTAFLAVVGLLKDFESRNYYRTFTKHRREFEDFILKHKDFANQVAGIIGSGTKGLKPLQTLYQTIFDYLVEGLIEKEILEALLPDERFKFLKLPQTETIEYGRDFNIGTKSTAFLREALKNALTCEICHGFIHVNSISFDHKERKADGGIGTPDNAQLTHPYCNTTYKH